MKHQNESGNLKTKKYIMSRVVLSVLMFIGFLGFFSANWYDYIYGDVGTESVVFTLFASMGGVQEGLVLSWVVNGLVPAIIFTLIAVFLLLVLPYVLIKRNQKRAFLTSRKVLSILAGICAFSLFLAAFCDIGLDEWTINFFRKTDIYEKEYVDPNKTKITFPSKKRNLVYIYLESMETTYMSKEQGGDFEESVIPQLYKLAEENTNFSQNSGVGGAQSPHGTTWTIGAMISHTAAIPMKSPVSLKASATGKYYENAASLNTVLNDNGYNQAVMVGSQSQYGGRKEYFYQHGVDKVYDIYTAYDDKIVPDGYFEWWGMEDKHLYSYAKKEITEMSKQSEPFAFTMLTVDTHHVEGYICSECKSDFDEQYSNVFSCASRQLYEFIEWIKQQDFYENTTVVVAGDHPTMGYQYVVRNADENSERRIYNCFINAVPDGKNSKNREFTTLDMFPTTLAAMGCSIEGDRLGLGVNLYSGRKTLCEKYGFEGLNSELSKSSTYYNTMFD